MHKILKVSPNFVSNKLSKSLKMERLLAPKMYLTKGLKKLFYWHFMHRNRFGGGGVRLSEPYLYNRIFTLRNLSSPNLVAKDVMHSCIQSRELENYYLLLRDTKFR